MGPLALRNAIAGLQWGRAGAQERHFRDGMGPLALRNAIPETE